MRVRWGDLEVVQALGHDCRHRYHLIRRHVTTNTRQAAVVWGWVVGTHAAVVRQVSCNNCSASTTSCTMGCSSNATAEIFSCVSVLCLGWGLGLEWWGSGVVVVGVRVGMVGVWGCNVRGVPAAYRENGGHPTVALERVPGCKVVVSEGSCWGAV